MMHRRFPEIKVSLYHLRLAYREAGIKKKQISIKKQLNAQHQARIRAEAREALARMQRARVPSRWSRSTPTRIRQLGLRSRPFRLRAHECRCQSSSTATRPRSARRSR